MAKKTNRRQIYVKPEIETVALPDALMYIDVSMDKAPKIDEEEEEGTNRPEAKFFNLDLDRNSGSLDWDDDDLDDSW